MKVRRNRQLAASAAGLAFLISLGFGPMPAGAQAQNDPSATTVPEPVGEQGQNIPPQNPPPTVLGTVYVRDQNKDQVQAPTQQVLTPCQGPLCETDGSVGNGTKVSVDGTFYCQPKGIKLTFGVGSKVGHSVTFTATLTSLVDAGYVRNVGPYTVAAGKTLTTQLIDMPFGSVLVRSVSSGPGFYSTTGSATPNVRTDVVPCECDTVPTTPPTVSPVTSAPLPSPSTPGAPATPAPSLPGAPSSAPLTFNGGELPATGSDFWLFVAVGGTLFLLGFLALRGTRAPDIDVDDFDGEHIGSRWHR